MEDRFTSAQVLAAQFRAVQVGAVLGLTSLLSIAPFASSARAQPANSSNGVQRTINAAPPSVRRPDLELGRRGGAVAELQGVLKLLGFYSGEVHGRYDEATSLAVARFQVAAKLPQTGRVSSPTWDALFPADVPSEAIATAPTPSASPAPPRPAPAPPAPQPPPQPATPQPPITQPAPPNPAAQPATAPPAASAPNPPAAQPTAPPRPPSPYPTLRLGAEGDAVLRLQRRLSQKGFLEGQPDGDFGPMTETAVKAAQEALGLTADGVVGPATWQALLK